MPGRGEIPGAPAGSCSGDESRCGGFVVGLQEEFYAGGCPPATAGVS